MLYMNNLCIIIKLIFLIWFWKDERTLFSILIKHYDWINQRSSSYGSSDLPIHNTCDMLCHPHYSLLRLSAHHQTINSQGSREIKLRNIIFTNRFLLSVGVDLSGSGLMYVMEISWSSLTQTLLERRQLTRDGQEKIKGPSLHFLPSLCLLW